MTASTTTVMHQQNQPIYYGYNPAPARHLVERCVLVTRQPDGYGLTVTGEHPVFVSDVKAHGAASVAGVQTGDQVLKVNGMPVTGSNYQEVLRMISEGCNLALTLLSPVQFSYYTPDQSLNFSEGEYCAQSYDTGTYGYRRFSKSDFSTLPRQENFSKRYSVQSNMTEPIFSRRAQSQNVRELRRMLSKEQRHLELLKQSEDYVDSTHSAKLEHILKRIDQLQEQLVGFDEVEAGCSTTLQSVKSDAPPSAPSSLVGDSIAGSGYHRPYAYSRYHDHGHNRRDSHRSTGPVSVVSGSSVSAEPVKSWVESGGLHYVQSAGGGPTDLQPMEEESVEEDVDRDVSDNSGPFSNLIDLKSRPAHLAVFINYLVNKANPNSLLFYLISDAFQATANTKELRRFAYEIFSTFIIPNAPLQLPNATQPLCQQIDKALRATPGGTSQDMEHLRRLFLPARTRAIGNIYERLAQFRRRHALSAGGGDAFDGVDARQLELARTDHGTSTKIAEHVLFRLLDALVAQCNGNVSFDGDMPDARKLALVASLATIIKAMGLRTNHTPWEKILEKCPTFVTSSRSTVLSKIKPKRNAQVKDHQFSLNPVCLTTACYQCRDVFWGVNPQAYFCQYCDVVVHKQCTAKLVDHCYPVAAQQQKRSTGNVGTTVAKAAPTATTAKPRPVAPAVSASSVSLDAARVHGVGTPDAIDYDHGVAGGSTSNVYYHHQSRISAPESYLSIGSSSTGELTGSGVRQKATSATPPLCRSHASTATIVGSTAGGGVRAGLSGSRSHLNYAVDDEPDEDAEAESELIAHIEGSGSGVRAVAKPLPSIHTTAAATTFSSPASLSKSMLPPPVFSQKIERIIPPQPPDADHVHLAQPPTVPRAAALAAAAAASESSDSGIGNELLLVGADGHAISRAHSMKVEASSNQSSLIRRNGRGANSLGAADSPTGSASTLVGAAPGVATAVASPLARDSRNAASSKSSTNLVDMSKVGQQFPTGLVVAPQCIVVAPTLHHHALSVESEAPAFCHSLTASTSTLRVTTPSTAVPPTVTTVTPITVALSTDAAEMARQLTECVERTVIPDEDSDLDVDTEVPSLESLLSWEVLRHLKPKEKKRQEVINEFFHTERTHLRNLKILYKLFYRPMVLQKMESPELINLLFGNLDALLHVHSEMCAKMRAALAFWRQQFAAGTLTLAGGVAAGGAEAASETGSAPSSTAQAAAAAGGGSAPPYGNIGELVEGIFSGEAGERMMAETALFCENQQHALDTLRQRYNRNSKEDAFSAFLVEAESNPLCRKLQLKDMIPVEMQRLVKYPLLLETIAKYTPDPSDELTRLLHGATCAKRILSAVNTAKRNAENRRRLEELQKRVDFSAQDKFAAFFQKFDFRNHRLIYEGTLLWRQPRGKTVELHVVLLDHLLVFLTRVGGDGTPSGGPNVRWQLKVAEAGCLPIMRLSYVEVEEKSVDKRTFNLLYKCDLRLFELVAPTATERKTWHRLIENQIAVSSQDLPAAGEELNNFFNAVAATGNVIKVLAPSAGVADSGAQALARVEQVHVLTQPNLVTANQIVVEQPRILEHAQLEHAPPSPQAQLGPVERLHRFDKIIVNALCEKHSILMEMLKEEAEEGNDKDLEKIAEQLAGLTVSELKHRNPRELAVSTIVFGNRLLDSINTGMTSISETRDPSLPSVPCYKLTAIAAPLMNHIKALTQLVQEQERQRPQPQRQNSNNDMSSNSAKTKTLVSTVGAPPLTTHRNNCVGIAAALIGDDDGAPPPLPPSSAPPPLDD